MAGTELELNSPGERQTLTKVNRRVSEGGLSRISQLQDFVYREAPTS